MPGYDCQCDMCVRSRIGENPAATYAAAESRAALARLLAVANRTDPIGNQINNDMESATADGIGEEMPLATLAYLPAPPETCDECGARPDHWEYLRPAPDNRKLCNVCFYDAWYVCYGCDLMGVRGEEHQLHEEQLCDSCIGNYVTCESCGYILNIRNIRTYHNEDLCGDCYHDRRANNHDGGGIHDYSYRPTLRYYHNGYGKGTAKSRPNELYLGIELELEVEDGWDSCLSLLGEGGKGRFIAKEDSSIDGGFECVSQPMNLAAWHGFDLSWLKSMSDEGASAWHASSCGLHIHMSVNGFRSKSHIQRWWMLMFGNSDDWIALAGRNSSMFANWNNWEDVGAGAARAYAMKPDHPIARQRVRSTELDDFYLDDIYTTPPSESEREEFERRWRRGLAIPKMSWNQLSAKAQKNHARYTAVNCQNTNTVELRFWRPSLRPATVMAAIEASAASVEYTRHMPFNVDMKSKGLDFETFVSWAEYDGRFCRFVDRAKARVYGNDTGDMAFDNGRDR